MQLERQHRGSIGNGWGLPASLSTSALDHLAVNQPSLEVAGVQGED